MVWLLWVASGCSGHFACVSEDWVVDGDGAPVEACVNVRDRKACEDLIGHPTYAGSCGASFSVMVADCAGLTFTDAAQTQLPELGVAGEAEVAVSACGAGSATTGDPTGDTAR